MKCQESDKKLRLSLESSMDKDDDDNDKNDAIFSLVYLSDILPSIDTQQKQSQIAGPSNQKNQKTESQQQHEEGAAIEGLVEIHVVK